MKQEVLQFQQRVIRGLALLVILVFTALNLSARDLTADFDAANKLYEQGRYAEAITAYDKLLAAGNITESLYFNRGNAEFKQGQIGRAIASYREAQHFAPRDRELLANLQLARTRARGGSQYHVDRLHVWLERLSLNEWALLTSVSLWALFTMLAFVQWRVNLKSRLRSYIFAAAGASAFFALCLGAMLNLDYLRSTAIVVTGEADVRNGPLEESPSIFKVRDGAELQVLDAKGDWLQILDPAQRVGWLRQAHVIVFDAKGIHGATQ